MFTMQRQRSKSFPLDLFRDPSAECRQGSFISGQVFIGTNSNFLVLIGTLIFEKVLISQKFIKKTPPRIQILINKVTFATENVKMKIWLEFSLLSFVVIG